MPDTREIAAEIRRKALELGFSGCGFSTAVPLGELRPGYLEWLQSGKAGSMEYLGRNIEVRLDPDRLVEGARTVISLAAGYYHPTGPHREGSPRISRYACGEDYHRILKEMGHRLLEHIQTVAGPVRGRVFTDSAPLFEREWARRAGIGWIGRNGCLIIPKLGSWFFLAEIVTDLAIEPDVNPVPDRCGNCTRCVEACPTHALEGDGTMDPRKCISYLTIEHKGDIPDGFSGSWKDWVFGCDICQDVCPWNRTPLPSPIPAFMPRPGLPDLNPEIFMEDDGERWWPMFRGTPVERTGWQGLLRNFRFLEKE